MALLKPIGGVIGGLLKGLGVISTPKPTALSSAPLPMAQRDDAAAQQEATDELRRRRGGAADIITGAAGAEAPLTGGKLILGA